MILLLRIRRPPRFTRTTHSFPTRRSSDLCPETVELTGSEYKGLRPPLVVLDLASRNLSRSGVLGNPSDLDRAKAPSQALRSEEHTSELQSLMRTSYAVFCLKQKKNHRSIY